MTPEEEKAEIETTIREIIKCCTDEELAELMPDIEADTPEDAERLGITWDYMNDEADAESVRSYIADYFIEFSTRLNLSKLMKHVWDRLFSTLESQGYRPTKHGLTHESEI